MRTKNVNTATNESAEHFYQEFTESCFVVQPKTKLKVVPFLFCSPAGDTLVADWLRRHSDYDGGNWDYYLIPEGVQGKIAPRTTITTQVITGFIAPSGHQLYKTDMRETISVQRPGLRLRVSLPR